MRNLIVSLLKKNKKFPTEYIDPSRLPDGGRNQQICNYTMPAKNGNVCAVDVNNWGPCSPSQQYGFNNSAPCIFIKLNRVRRRTRTLSLSLSLLGLKRWITVSSVVVFWKLYHFPDIRMDSRILQRHRELAVRDAGQPRSVHQNSQHFMG